MHHAMHHATTQRPHAMPPCDAPRRAPCHTPPKVRLTFWLDGRGDISAAMILMPYIAAFVLVLVLLGRSNPYPYP